MPVGLPYNYYQGEVHPGTPESENPSKQAAIVQVTPGESVTFDFLIPRRRLLNANVPVHYRDKAGRAKWLRKLPRELGDLPFSFERFDVTVEVYSPSKRRLDPANLAPTAKHLIDGLTDAQLWPDDDWVHLRRLTFQYGGLTGLSADFFILRLSVTKV